jgi:hypothetical protein
VSQPCTLFGPCNCASCRAAVPDTPLDTANPPGLTALKYRIGTFSTFRQAMLDYITLNPVANPSPGDTSQIFTLTSRSSDDYGIAMLELWAYVCDVLTFYQQAIVNEAYLRTATQQRSLVRLANLLGYRPAPGVAASAFLAFLTSKGATALVPTGLQAQSVPDPGAQPAIFEAANAISAVAVDNLLVLSGPSITLWLDQSGSLIGDDPANPIAKGNRILFFDTASGFVSEQQVSAVTPQAAGTLVDWRGHLNGRSPSATKAYRLGRTFRCFGANAPLHYVTVSVTNNTPSWSSQTTEFALASGVPSSQPLWLDAVYSGLGSGSPMLVQYKDGSGVHLVFAPISSVTNQSVTVGPMTGNSTGVQLASGSLPSEADLRNVTVYELLGDALIFASAGFAGTYPALTQSIYFLDATALSDGTLLAFSSGGAGDVVAVSGKPVAITDHGVTLGYRVSLKRALTNGYDPSTTQVYGNVVAATQGKTQPIEILGSGDASQPWQEFALKGKPVTYVANAASERGAASTLQVFVNDIAWTEIDSFYGRSGRDQVFITRTGDDGTAYVRFGDGDTGQRPPTGNRNIKALYRVGAGSNGNVAAGKISNLLQTPAGLQSVTNPVPAVGGGDSESPDRIRENAPVSVLTLGRAVSLRDYEALALTYRDGAISKARASWADFNDKRGVTLTLAGAGGLPLGQLVQPVRDFLDDFRDPNVPLAICDATLVFFVFRAIVHVANGYLQSAVKASAEATMGVTGDTGYLSYAALQIGESIWQSRLLATLQDAKGVDWVELKEFSTAYSSGRIGFSPDALTSFPMIQPGHKRLDVLYIDPRQMARPSLTSTAADISVDLSYSGGVNDLQ